MSMTELEAARLVRAALELIHGAVPHMKTRAGIVALSALENARTLVYQLEQAAPPWEPEPGPSAERPWSEVIPGDKVLAPNGRRYNVESVVRIGDRLSVILESNGMKAKSDRRAHEVVKVERGDAGRAVDVFAAGGITLEPIGAGK